MLWINSYFTAVQPATDDFRVQPFCGFHETIKHCFKREPGILDAIPVSPEIDTESVPGQLVPVGGCSPL